MSETGYHFDDDVQQRSYDSTLLLRMLDYVRPYRNSIIVATFLLLIVSFLSNLIPLIMMRSVDTFMNAPGNDAGADSAAALANIDGLMRLTYMVVGLVFAEGILRYAQLLIVVLVGQHTMLAMRMNLFDHLQRLSLRYLDRNPVGRLMSRVTNDVDKIQQTIVTAVVQVMSGIFTILVILCFMFYFNWTLALVALLPVPVIMFSSFLFRRFAQQSFLEIRRKIAELSSFMQESITGIRVVQLFGLEEEREGRFATRNADHRDEWLRQIKNFAVYFPVVEFLSDLSLALILLYTGSRILSLGEEITHVASVGTFVGYVFWSQRLYMPIRSMADRYNLLLEAMASSERVFQLLDTPEDITDAPDARVVESLQGRVTFDQVWFAYEDENWVIRDLSVDISPGERVAIVGHTGAGKSTFINLVSRFYEVQRGAVRVDGIDVREYRQATLRRHIGIVLQDVFLFTGSIEDNIRLGDEEMDEAWIRACAEAVNAAPFIERMPGGYAYNVGERGRNLSTGQRQLVAFARTLAHRPNILVLDEATSSIDTDTELLIQDAMETLMEGRTSIVIAHRLSTIQHADRILVMHHGELREQGTHDELIAHGGLYRTLYELQFSGLEETV